VRGLKNVTYNEGFLQHHFPDYPIYPGALIVEAVAQLSGFLLEYSLNRDPAAVRRAVLIQIERAKFHKAVQPGDRMQMECVIDSLLGDAAQVNGTVRIDEELSATLSLRFKMHAVAQERVHLQQRELYRQWTRGLNLEHPIL
jgi:3-hydroxyacyl-[acyl-carrier-protein] dehydratase